MTKRNSKGIGQKSSFPDSKVNKQTNKRKRKRSLSDVYIGHLRTAADVEAAVTIKKSLIIAAGAGAFTTVDIARGTCLGFYKGIPTTAQQREDPLFSGAYWFESHNRDATDPAGRLKLPGKEEALVNVAGWLKEDWEGVPEGARWNGSTSNWTRFMNHASGLSQNVSVSSDRARFGKCLAFYAKRRIAAGEELFFSYNSQAYFERLGITPVNPPLPAWIMEEAASAHQGDDATSGSEEETEV